MRVFWWANMSYSKYLAISVSAVAVSIAAFMYWRRKQRKEFYPSGQVTGLYIYPVKSCKGVPLSSALCLDEGLLHDRRWIILNEKDRLVTAREKPKLQLVTPTLQTTSSGELESLSLNAPNMDTLTIKMPLVNTTIKDISVYGLMAEVQYAGDEAAEWIAKYLNKPGYQLYHMTKPRYIANDEIWGDIVKPDDKHGFADFSPLMITTEEALSALNNELETAVSMRRFRPNIIVKGTKTFDEDNWKELKINDVRIRCYKNCARCVMTTIDPDLGEKTGKEPLETLKRTRMPENRDKRFGDSPFFGVEGIADKQGIIKVGDAVFARQ
ncbi:mitochondrial amidoxime-reducing component 1 [Exaiptasia diaphana]|uniref:MOSC domain-containing protein n=1 Tax=Exaiptasia diaphana TaxID=2652724 RepID=A0A913WW23_EXADI|nr:mitochondrial amidoxime-reducing component 1 [Exaiptasia diaphana]KXJ17521.1 Mitochondrial amidoxime-reducing component 1 [Exaiptasia diaphana]